MAPDARPTRVGLIGTGIIGAPMGRNLMKAGFSLTVFTRTRSRADGLLAAGAEWADSPSALAGRVDVVISIVPDSPDVERVYLGHDGVCSALRRGGLAIDMSTVAPAMARLISHAVQERGAHFVDAPVSGGKTGAEAGTLSIMAGG